MLECEGLRPGVKEVEAVLEPGNYIFKQQLKSQPKLKQTQLSIAVSTTISVNISLTFLS